MKRLFFIISLLFSFLLIAETVSFESPMGNMKFSIEGGGDAEQKKTIVVVDKIAENIDLLEKNFCAKLNNFDQRKAKKIIDEIYDLLTLVPEDIVLTQTLTQTKTEQNTQNPNININFNMQETKSEPVVEETEPVVEQKVVEKPQNEAMTEAEFQQFLKSVENESFADEKLSVVRIAAKNKYFTIDQLIRLVGVFSFSDEQIESVRICYPRVVDKDNAHNLIGAFTYSDDKMQVEQIINR